MTKYFGYFKISSFSSIEDLINHDIIYRMNKIRVQFKANLNLIDQNSLKTVVHDYNFHFVHCV